MCGGRGTRLESPVEKPLFEAGGVPMVDSVLEALADSAIDRVFAVTSPHAPATHAHVEVPCIETPGEGYVADLDAALSDDRLTRPVLTVAADLPLLNGAILDRVLDAYDGASLSVLVPAARKRELGVSVDTTFGRDGREVTPTGVNVVDASGEDAWLTDDRRLAVNVNRPADAVVAESLL